MSNSEGYATVHVNVSMKIKRKFSINSVNEEINIYRKEKGRLKDYNTRNNL